MGVDVVAVKLPTKKERGQHEKPSDTKGLALFVANVAVNTLLKIISS